MNEGSFLAEKSNVHEDAFARRHFCTKKLLHGVNFAQRHFYTGW